MQLAKRGAIPTPRGVLAAATPFQRRIGAPPNFITIPQHISFWGNNEYGDCVSAEEAFAKACHAPEIFISDADLIAWASRHGVLNGAYLTQVMDFMQHDGFVQGSVTQDDGPYVSVNWTDSVTLKSAISSGPVKIGVAADQIETAWRAGNYLNGWLGTGFHADANEDHCVSLCGYGTIAWLAQQLGAQVPAGVDGSKDAYAMFTWNSIGIIDVASMKAVTHEAWLRQPTTISRPNVSVNNTLAFIKTANTPGNRVEVHLASGTSGYTTRILEIATTFGNENDGTWQLLPSRDLVFIKTRNTPSGRVEVHIASSASDYQTRVLETATTFGNEADGTWQLLPE